MKKIKVIALALALVMALSTLTGCNIFGIDGTLAGVGGGRLKTVTLSKYLSDGPVVGFYQGDSGLDKNDYPDAMFLFEAGKIYYVYSFDEYDKYTDDYKLTWGEIAQMSDKELVKHAKNYMTLHREANNYRMEYDPNDANIVVQQGDWSTFVKETLKKPGDTYVRNLTDGYFKVNNDYEGMITTEIEVAYYNDTYHRNGYSTCHLIMDKDGNLYFGTKEDYSDSNGNREKFDKLTPYDDRYGKIKLPAITFKYDYRQEMTTGKYTLHLITDNTGNNVEKEELLVEYISSNGETEVNALITLINAAPITESVYESAFTRLFSGSGQSGLIFRTGRLNITLDNIGTKGVEVD